MGRGRIIAVECDFLPKPVHYYKKISTQIDVGLEDGNILLIINRGKNELKNDEYYIEKAKQIGIEYEMIMDRKIKNMISFMNNAKWYKLFKTLSENNIIPFQIKFLIHNHLYGELYEKREFKMEYFSEKGVEYYDVHGDCVETSYFYKEIEWKKMETKELIKQLMN